MGEPLLLLRFRWINYYTTHNHRNAVDKHLTSWFTSNQSTTFALATKSRVPFHTAKKSIKMETSHFVIKKIRLEWVSNPYTNILYRICICFLSKGSISPKLLLVCLMGKCLLREIVENAKPIYHLFCHSYMGYVRCHYRGHTLSIARAAMKE